MKCVILFRSGFGGGLASGGSITHVPTWHIIISIECGLCRRIVISGLQYGEWVLYMGIALQSKHRRLGLGRRFVWTKFINAKIHILCARSLCYLHHTSHNTKIINTVNNHRRPTLKGAETPPLAASLMPTSTPIGTKPSTRSMVWKSPKSYYVVFMPMVLRNHLLFNNVLLNLPCWVGI